MLSPMIIHHLRSNVVVVVAFAVSLIGCLADRSLPAGIGARTPCVSTADCPQDHVCPLAGAAENGAALPSVCVPRNAPACGNAVRDEASGDRPQEECDDGNLIGADGCRANCTLERCGDGIVDRALGEVCDGPTPDGEVCRADCQKVERCGDAVVDADNEEQCDDGNENPNDGCDACRTTRWKIDVVTGAGAGGGTIALTSYLEPSAAVDREGQLFVADLAHIDRIDEEGGRVDIVVAGTRSFGFSGDGGPAAGAQIDSPQGPPAIDGAGRMFFGDTGNQRVRVVDLDGTIRTIAGTGAVGPPQDGIPALVATFFFPFQVALDHEGRVLIDDIGNCAIRRIEADGSINTVAGGDCEAGPFFPFGLRQIAVGPDALYVADSNTNIVWRVEPAVPASNAVIEPIAGTGEAGDDGDDGAATDALLSGPNGVAVDAAGRIFIADTGNHRIRVVDGQGVITTFAGTVRGFGGDGGPATLAQIDTPASLSIDDVNSRLIIADNGNARVRSVELAATPGAIRTLVGDPGRVVPAVLSSAGRLAADAQGRVYSSDDFNQVVVRVDPATANDEGVTTVAGTAHPAFSGDDGPGGQAGIDSPHGLALDAAGNLFIADLGNRRIRRVDASSGIITTVVGNGEAHDPVTENVGPALSVDAGSVGAIAVDSRGRIYFNDLFEDGFVRRVDDDGVVRMVIGDGSGPGFVDADVGIEARIGHVEDFGIDASDRLYIADGDNGRIRRYDPDTDRVTTIAGTGAEGFNGDDQLATLANLDVPVAVDVDAAGNIFIADGDLFFAPNAGAARVRRVDSNGIIHTVIGDGNRRSDGDGGLASAAHVTRLFDVAAAPSGRLFLVDANEHNSVLRIVDDALSGTGIVDAVLRDAVFPFGVGSLDGGALAQPSALATIAPGVALTAGGRSGVVERVRDPGVLGGGSGGTIDVVTGDVEGLVVGADPFALDVGGVEESRASFAAAFGDACGIAWDAAASFAYVSDRARGVIERLRVTDAADPSTWTIELVPAVPPLVGPCGLAVDPLDPRTLIVTDAGDHTVRALDIDTGANVLVFGISGVAGRLDDLLFAPRALAFEPTSLGAVLFVADTGNHRVRRLSLKRDQGSGAVVDVEDVVDVIGTGEAASAGDGAPSANFPVESPRGLTFDSFGNLFVTSTRAVRVVTPSPAGLVDGSGEVLTIYGAAPRSAFPESRTFCLSGIELKNDDVVRITDACQGYLLELTRVAN